MRRSLASLGLVCDKKHWLRMVGEKEPGFFDFPFEKAHVLPGSFTAILWHDLP